MATLFSGCGSGSGSSSSDTGNAAGSSSTTISRQGFEVCLAGKGVKVSGRVSAGDQKLAAAAKERFHGIFKGKDGFGETVDDVSFLIYDDTAGATAAHEKIAREVGTQRRTAVRNNLVAVFGPTRSQAQTIVVLNCLDQPGA